MPYQTPGDGGHSVLFPDEGDFRGDATIWEHPIDAITQAADRFPSYGNWAGPGNVHDEEIKRRMTEANAAHRPYDPSTDPDFGADTAIDGLDAAARVHDLQYYRDNSDANGKETNSMFSLQGLLNTADADRTLQRATAREMDHPSIGADGRPIEYSDSTRTYADGLQGLFGGRADGVDIRQAYIDGSIDELGVLDAAAGDIGKAYDHNGLLGAVTEGVGLANVAGAQAAHSAYELGSEAVTAVGDAAHTVYNTAADVGTAAVNGVSSAAHTVGDAATSVYDYIFN